MVIERRFERREAMETAMLECLVEALAGRAGRPPYGVMLTGGGTAAALYARLGRLEVRVDPGVYVVLSDERQVPPGDAAHNYRVLEPVLDALGVAAARRVVVRTELPLASAEEQFDREVRGALQTGPIALAVLGLGADGHLAGLFTEADVARGRGRCGVAVHRPDGMDGVTVSAEVLQGAARVVFFVCGAGKRVAVAGLLRNPAEGLAGRVLGGHPACELWHDGGGS